MLIHRQPESVTARQGCLDGRGLAGAGGGTAGYFFSAAMRRGHPGFTVDLMLDGSASRLTVRRSSAQGIFWRKPEQLQDPIADHQLLQPAGLHGCFGS